MNLDEQIVILQAAKDGKKIEVFENKTSSWREIGAETYKFQFFTEKYRIVEEPKYCDSCGFPINEVCMCNSNSDIKLVPLTEEILLKNTPKWFKRKDGTGGCVTLCGVYTLLVQLCELSISDTSSSPTYQTLLDEWLCTFDGKTWIPCGIREE